MLQHFLKFMDKFWFKIVIKIKISKAKNLQAF